MITYLTFFLFSVWKFMFTPLAGPAAGLNFWETFFSCLAGGYFSATLFYFSSSYFMQRAVWKRAEKEKKRQQLGKKIKKKKRFTRTNRWIIKIKRSFGMYAVTWAFPLFLSIPLGTIITAKFYKHQKTTFPLILFFLTIDCLLITGGIYLFNYLWI
ncbi:MAG: hypothetical protein ACQERC_06795 [Bacteroidota bacterium]